MTEQIQAWIPTEEELIHLKKFKCFIGVMTREEIEEENRFNSPEAREERYKQGWKNEMIQREHEFVNWVADWANVPDELKTPYIELWIAYINDLPY